MRPSQPRSFLKSSGLLLLVAVVVASAAALGLRSLAADTGDTPSWAATYTSSFMMSKALPANQNQADRPAAAPLSREESLKLIRSWRYTDFPPTQGG